MGKRRSLGADQEKMEKVIKMIYLIKTLAAM
jgi:hypothetical protein